MTTPETAPRKLEGTDLLRMIAYMCDGEGLNYFIANVRPGLVNYSEIELWALAGIFLGSGMADAADFIAFYADQTLSLVMVVRR
jgi:hypothetical protein